MRTTLRERFDSKREAITESGCWIWTGSLTSSGYGRVMLGPAHRRTNVLAHRLSWELYRGPIPDGLFVCHRCDVKYCVNPDHLFLGTNGDNMHDLVQKGLTAKGEDNSIAKLSNADAEEIRRLYKRGKPGQASETSQSGLAKRYGVNQATVSRIVRGLVYCMEQPT